MMAVMRQRRGMCADGNAGICGLVVLPCVETYSETETDRGAERELEGQPCVEAYCESVCEKERERQREQRERESESVSERERV